MKLIVIRLLESEFISYYFSVKANYYNMTATGKNFFRKTISTEIKFNTLVQAIGKYKSIHFSKNRITKDLIDLDFIYHRASLNSTKSLNARIYTTAQNDNNSIIEVKANRLALVFMSLSPVILISIALFQNMIGITTGIIALIILEFNIFFIFRIMIFDPNIKMLIHELEELIADKTNK